MNREEWLNNLADRLLPWFAENGLTPTGPIRVSCGWPFRSPRKVEGECWSSKCAEDGSRQIHVSPKHADGMRVARILAHEILHACMPDGTGHKGAFKQGCKTLGLDGKPTSAEPGPETQADVLQPILDDLGPYPHSALTPGMEQKKQSTRMLKIECPSCGFIARTTAKWIEEIGLPTCACGTAFVEA